MTSSSPDAGCGACASGATRAIRTTLPSRNGASHRPIVRPGIRLRSPAVRRMKCTLLLAVLPRFGCLFFDAAAAQDAFHAVVALVTCVLEHLVAVVFLPRQQHRPAPGPHRRIVD